MKTLAISFTGPHKVELIEVDVPAPGSGDALVRTLYSGISPGSEMLAYRGEIDPALPLDDTIGALSGTFSYPFQYGYSCVGRVEESDGAIAPGTLVFAFHPHQAMFVLETSQLIRIDGIAPRKATFFPLVETAFQVALDAGDVADETVVVVGLGPIGVLTAALLRRRGARVIGSDLRLWRCEIARCLDIHAVAPEELPRLTDEATGGNGVPLLIEASGNPDALGETLSLLAHEGTVLVASWYGDRPVELALGREFHRRRLTLRSTQVSTIPSALSARWTVPRRRAAALAAMNELPLELLTTHDFDVTDAASAFDAIDRGEPGLMHAALRYGAPS